jgi:hypothetical protein
MTDADVRWHEMRNLWPNHLAEFDEQEAEYRDALAHVDERWWLGWLDRRARYEPHPAPSEIVATTIEHVGGPGTAYPGTVPAEVHAERHWWKEGER